MPAPARITVPVKETTDTKPVHSITPKATISRHKTRVMRRRRTRGRLDDTDTEEDLVREPRSDDDSDSASSILDSESETVSESESEPQDQKVPRRPSPSHAPVNGVSPSPPPPPVDKRAAFPQTVNWSEIVAEENATGAAELPVINFTDLSEDVQTAPASLPEASAVGPSTTNSVHQEASHDASERQTPRRHPGQSARQAYRERLDTDPAYVPTLGQFWSHDDRLLDKDLRSLSGWWRGRWQTRGRGRGFVGGWGMRERDLGFDSKGLSQSPGHEDAAPVERAWTHDGFEEMKRVDEERRKQRAFRGQGGFPRGRGGFRGGFHRRGGFSGSPHGSAQTLSESHSAASDTLRFGSGTRTWFAMKPERVWTKQFDAYLYFEAPLKPIQSQGLGQGVRIRLPGKTDGNDGGIVVRLPIHMASPPHPVFTKELYGERTFVVKLPGGKRAGKEPIHEDAFLPEDLTTVAPPPMEDPVPPSPQVHVLATETTSSEDFSAYTPAGPSTRHASEAVSLPSQVSTNVETSSPDAPLEYPPFSVPDDFPAAGPSHSASQTQDGMPQTTLQPTASTFLSSQQYGSPYGYAAPSNPLPPGIAVSESGVTYEVATGRAVFLHTPPPPPPPLQMQGALYNPRPMPMHHGHHGSVHFLPPMPSHHNSISPPGFLTGSPIFSLPRQSSRVEIRAPGEKNKNRAETGQSRSTGRSAVNVNAQPFTPATQAPSMGYYSAESHAGFDDAQPHHQFAYQPAQYYYPLTPDGSMPYGYGQYAHVDAGQPQQYEQYVQDSYPPQHQHTGYY